MQTLENEMVGHFNILKAVDGELRAQEDHLAIEDPLEIQLESGSKRQSLSVTMRTPGNDDELAVGFLFTEGIITHVKQIAVVSSAGSNRIVVSLKENENAVLRNSERNFYTTSSCGVCGKASIESIKTISPFQLTEDEIRVDRKIFQQLESALRNQQEVFLNTGGLHASGLFSVQGSLIDVREDVGRHNALDKLIGSKFLQDQLPLDHHILLLSGRASFELIQKARMAGIKIVAAIGAPSSLAVQMAVENNMTLIGFLRKSHFNIYSGHQRIIGA